MEALDKVFDTQVITGIDQLIEISFHWSEKKENFLYEEEEERKRQERRYQSYNNIRRERNRLSLQRRKSAEFIKNHRRVNGTLNDVCQRFSESLLLLYDSVNLFNSIAKIFFGLNIR